MVETVHRWAGCHRAGSKGGNAFLILTSPRQGQPVPSWLGSADTTSPSQPNGGRRSSGER